MNPFPFEYHRAGSIDEAINLLQQHGDGAKLIAGGHSLLPVMKLRLAQPTHLIDIARIPGLNGVAEEGDGLRIGALTTHHAIETNSALRARCPLLPETARTIGDRQVRNRGTIGGALAHGDPAADYPAAILALDAAIVAQGPEGERTIPAADFFLGFLTTALAPDEVLTAVRIPRLPAGAGASYQKLANPASGYAIVGVAAVVSVGHDGRGPVRVGITGAAPSAVRATAVEEALSGGPLDPDAIAAAASRAADGLDLLDDVHAPADYRRQVTVGLTRRALLTAWERARSA